MDKNLLQKYYAFNLFTPTQSMDDSIAKVSQFALNPRQNSTSVNPSNPSYFEVVRCFGSEAIKDAKGNFRQTLSLQAHLDASVKWLKRSHDMSPNNGVSWGYSLRGKWRASYRETSGYIAETFFDIAHRHNDRDAWTRAVQIGHWLMDIQNADGSIANTRYGTEGIVFDTGQVLQGLLRTYQETQEEQLLIAAEEAADWLVKVADSSGQWTRHTYNGIPHAYNSRVAWILLKLCTISPTPKRKAVALENLNWAVSQQRNGLFEQCAFTPGKNPFTHTTAYAIRGLLEAGILLDEDKYLQAAIQGATTIINHLHDDGFLAGQISHTGKVNDKYSCLVGNCQMAIIWLKLFTLTKNSKYYEAAAKCLQYVMSCQDISTTDLNFRGAIKGSHPIWGKYAPLSYPNWAAKFFIDAMLLWINIQKSFA